MRVVNIEDFDDNGEPYVYIGRGCGRFAGSKWRNVFYIGQHGTRKEVIEKYRIWLHSNSALMSQLMELDGKILVCHCKPKPCHGDVLVETIENKKILDTVFKDI